MTVAVVVVFTVIAAAALLAGRLGVDSRSQDPSRPVAQWPFARRDG